VHDPALVRIFQSVGYLPRYAHRLARRNRSRTNAISQRRPFDEFHHKGTCAARILQAINGSDVRMIERRKNFGLALEASHAVSVACEGGRKDLDSYIAA